MEKDVSPGSSQSSYTGNQLDEPATFTPSDDYEPLPKRRRSSEYHRGRPTNQMCIPIILPKLPAKSSTAVRLMTSPPSIAPCSSDPRPLISLLDRTEFRDRHRNIVAQPLTKPKKCYYTELNEIRKEFDIPEDFDSNKPYTMSGVALSEKLQLLQRLRGENKFLRESIQTKQDECEARYASIEQVRHATAETLDHCQMIKDTLSSVLDENERMRNQLK